MFSKKRLLTPGPVEMPPAVLLEMAKPAFHHRTQEYSDLLKEVVDGLQYVFQTKSDVVVLSTSGTGAMEAAIANTLSPGERALVVRGGKFGERWVEICEANKLEPVVIDVEWGESVRPEVIAQHLKDSSDIAAILVTLCETSTGVVTDIEAIGKIVSDYPALLIVDGVSGVGAMEMRVDEWGVDILVVGSQKALMIPPGLAFLSIGEKALRKIDACPNTMYYLDLKKAIKKGREFDHPYTPANTLVRALRVSLDMIRSEGIENVWRRHAILAEATRAGVQAIGLELFSRSPANAVTAVKAPPDIDGKQITKVMTEKYGLTISGGQDHLKGKIIRIAHVGYVDRLDVITALSALEMVLSELGYELKRGASVAAAEEVFLS